MTRFYAAQYTRGFANEIKVHTFSSHKSRDKWVVDHEDDDDVAYKITSKRAREILGVAAWFNTKL